MPLISRTYCDYLAGRPIGIVIANDMITVALADDYRVYAHTVPTSELPQWTEFEAFEHRIYGVDDFDQYGLQLALEYLMQGIGLDPSLPIHALDIRQVCARVTAKVSS